MYSAHKHKGIDSCDNSGNSDEGGDKLSDVEIKMYFDVMINKHFFKHIHFLILFL